MQDAPETGSASPNQCGAGGWRWRRGPFGRFTRGMAALVPRAGGPGQGHKDPRPVYPPQLRSASRPPAPGPPSPTHRAASVSPRARPGRGRGGPGGGPRTCGRRQRASRLCPACWNSSRPRSRSPLRASVVGAASLRSLPLARWSDPPRGSAATRLGTWAAAEPYGKMAARSRPHHAAPGRPGHGASVVAAAGGESVPRHARVAVCTERWLRRTSAARAGSRVLPKGRRRAGRSGPVRTHMRRGPAPAFPPPYGEMATPALPLRRAWLPRLPVAVSRSSPSERHHGQSATRLGRWTQVRRAGACPIAGGRLRPPGGAEAGVFNRADRASPQRSAPGSRGHPSTARPPTPLRPSGSAPACGLPALGGRAGSLRDDQDAGTLVVGADPCVAELGHSLPERGSRAL